MTLFIACLLIYHFSLPWWLYVIAVAIWALRVSFLVNFMHVTRR
jgi:hypothetical protein